MSDTKHETIYWTYANKLDRSGRERPVWQIDRNGDVVIYDFPQGHPLHNDGRRMTVADMDRCHNCQRCDANGKPIKTEAQA